MVQTRSTTASITSQQSIPDKSPNSFDIPHELVLIIAEFLHIDDLNNFRQCNRRLSRIIGESCLFRYRIQPTFQAALAYALATDNVALWYYAFDNKKENDEIEYFEIAYLFLVRKSMDPKWSTIFVTDVVTKLSTEENTRLIAMNNVLKDRPYYKPIENFDLHSLEHDSLSLSSSENFYRQVNVVDTHNLIGNDFVYDNIAIPEDTWEFEAWQDLRERGILHLWKDQLLNVAAKQRKVETMKRLLLIKAKASDDTLQKFLESVTFWPLWDEAKMVILLTKRGFKIRKPLVSFRFFKHPLGMVLLQHLLDYNLMDTNVQLDLIKRSTRSEDTELVECTTMVVLNLCEKNLIDVQQKNDILFWVINAGMTKSVVTLLSHGAHLEALNECRQTPLLFAKLQGQKDIEEYLLILGANKAAVDATGVTYE